MNSYLFTAESVSEGHPDKLADQVSDSILDVILEQDPTARVAAGLASRFLVQNSYAIGVAQPISIMAKTCGTGKVSREMLTALVREHFDLNPKGIVKMRDLLRPISTKTAAYCHFGCDEPEFSLEAIDKATALKASV